MNTFQQKIQHSNQKNVSHPTTLTLCKNLENIGLVVMPLQNNNMKWNPNNYTAIKKGFANLVSSTPLMKRSVVWLDFEGIMIDTLLTRESVTSEIVARTQENFSDFDLTYKETLFKDGTRYLRMCLMVQSILVG